MNAMRSAPLRTRSTLHAVIIGLQAVVFSLFFAFAAQAKTLATLDWTVAETLIALGVSPKAVGDVQSYRQWVGEPELAEDTVDLGVRLQPNPEQILTLSRQHKDLYFINSGFYASASTMLTKFAPVDLVDFYTQGNAWQNIERATRKVAELIGKPHAYSALMARYWQKIEEIRPLVKPFTDRPVVLVQFIDARYLRIYSDNSPFGAVMQQLGFKNAWQGQANNWGFATIEMTQLAKLAADSRFIVVKPYPANIAGALKYNVVWQRLPMSNDPLVLPAVWTFGGIPSAQRFAQLLAQGLISGGEVW